MVTMPRRLVVVVDADPAFVESARLLLADDRVVGARTADEAAEIVLGGRVDAVLLGPSFASEPAIAAAAPLREADPTAEVILAAGIVTNRLLLAAMRAGVADVVEVPLTTERLAGALQGAAADGDPGTAPPSPPEEPRDDDAITVMLEFDAESESATPATFTPVEAGPATALPPSGPIDEPGATPDAPAPAAWSVPVAATFPVAPAAPPVPTVEVPPTEQAQIPPGWVEPAPAAPIPVPVAPAPAPETFLPPEPEPVVAEPDVRRVVYPVDAPPPPTAPPPTRPAEPRHAPPLDLERAGLLPADRDQRPHRRGTGTVVAVMAGKGGSGKTITATNLALALSFQRGEDTVVVVDADIQFGDVALLLQLDPVGTLGDAVARLDELTDARLDGMLLRHESGVRVLPAPLLPTSEDDLPAKGIVEVIERLKGMYEFVVVDTPPIFDDHLITVLESADEVLVVVDMDLPSVKNAKIALDTLRASEYPMDRVRLVVNRVNAKARLDLVELERSLGLRVAGSIPSDRLVPQSVNEGIPVVALSPRSRVARSFHALAQMLTAPQPSLRRR